MVLASPSSYVSSSASTFFDSAGMMMVPLDFLGCNFGLCCRWPFREVPSPSLAEPDLEEEGLLIWSPSSVDCNHGGCSVTGVGIDETGSSLCSEVDTMMRGCSSSSTSNVLDRDYKNLERIVVKLGMSGIAVHNDPPVSTHFVQSSVKHF
jgi:hypothetical protein